MNLSTATGIEPSEKVILASKTGILVSPLFSRDGSAANWIQIISADLVSGGAILEEWPCWFRAFPFKVTREQFILAGNATVIVLSPSPSYSLSAHWIQDEGAVRLAGLAIL